mmetsp:Transcript_21951/g.47396  ORF Transcript_21951/g.47396 Transcript_21951/m.47396 type:complete len:522 (-) Transcript_21951:314-1879(-)
MTLTTVVGSSGSGKTTFLNDVHKSHKCTYIRQYHTCRPYIPVTSIPNFDPTRLPYWHIYQSEGTADTIKVGGQLGAKFTAGLSGGQRKLLLFELICQRTAQQTELLIALDEPFAGVTDDFVPWIVERLHELKKRHNVILVTNDHVAALTDMADNTITVSAIDRTVVTIQNNNNNNQDPSNGNGKQQPPPPSHAVDRQRAIFALSLGDDYTYQSTSQELQFFYQCEILGDSTLIGMGIYAAVCYGLFVATFWDTNEDLAALVLVAGGIINYFSVNPYLLSLVPWRNAMLEECEALMHSSKGLNRALKVLLTILLIFVFAWAEFLVVNATTSGFSQIKFWVAMFFDAVSLMLGHICFGIYTDWDFGNVQLVGGLPFLTMIFFSTTFSPGAGVPVLKELRYLYARFYFWCMVPNVQDSMEGCPADNVNVLYLVLASMVGVTVFLTAQVIGAIRKKRASVEHVKLRESMHDAEFHRLQVTLYGEKALRQLNHVQSSSPHALKVAGDEAEDEDDDVVNVDAVCDAV